MQRKRILGKNQYYYVIKLSTLYYKLLLFYKKRLQYVSKVHLL